VCFSEQFVYIKGQNIDEQTYNKNLGLICLQLHNENIQFRAYQSRVLSVPTLFFSLLVGIYKQHVQSGLKSANNVKQLEKPVI